MKRTLLLIALALLVPPVLADAELVLKDGQVLSGVEVRRQGDQYLLQMETGEVLSMPVSLVDQVRLKSTRRTREGMFVGSAESLAGAGTEGQTKQKVEDLGPTNINVTDKVEDLAGDPIRYDSPAEQTAALGPAATWQKGPVESDWEPTESFDFNEDVLADSRSKFHEGPLDSSWHPQSVFDANTDVLAEGHSTFKQGPFDNSWVPDDGFKKRGTSYAGAPGARRRATSYRVAGRRYSGGPSALPDVRLRASMSSFRSRPAELSWKKVVVGCSWCFGGEPAVGSTPGVFREPVPAPIDPQTCADQLLGPLELGETTRLARLAGDPWDDLPLPVHEARAGEATDAPRAVFTTAAGDCDLLGGDLEAILGVKLSPEQAAAYGAGAWSRALDQVEDFRAVTLQQQVDYAFAVVALVDPTVTGSSEARIELLLDAGALDRVSDTQHEPCAESRKLRRKAAREAESRFHAPRVEPHERVDVVAFFTWSESDGRVVRHAVYLEPDGAVSLSQERTADHLGEHADSGG